MRLIICDNHNITINKEIDDIIIYTEDDQPCIGCFSCWCKDSCGLKNSTFMKSVFEKAEKIVLITKNTYGSISAPVKRIIDRSVSSVQPFFTFRNGLMRHKLKKNHKNKDLDVYFYGNSTNNERQTAKNMLSSLCENLGATLKNIYFNHVIKAVSV